MSKRKLLCWTAAIILAFVLALPLLVGTVARWLVVSDPLERADVIVVPGGEAPFRAMEPAEI